MNASRPRDEGVCFLERGRVQLKQRRDVVPVRHCHQFVLDPLSVRTFVNPAAVHLQGSRVKSRVKGQLYSIILYIETQL